MQILSALTNPDPRISTGTQPATTGANGSTAPAPTQSTLNNDLEVSLAETSERTSSLTYRRSERTTLHIQTQEGDVVRLKFSTRESTNLGVVQPQDGEGEATELTLEARSASKLSIKVHGDLNAEELSAIQDTIDRAVAIADDFFAGDVQAAFESAAALDIDGEQLANVNLKMRMKERFTYSAQGFPSVPAVLETPRTIAPTTVAASTDTPAVVATTAEPGETVPVTTASVEPTSDNPENSPGAAANSIDRFSALTAIGNFLGSILDAFSANSGNGQGGLLDISLRIHVVQSTIQTLSEANTPEEGPLPALVSETLDALAAQEQPPLDQVA